MGGIFVQRDVVAMIVVNFICRANEQVFNAFGVNTASESRLRQECTPMQCTHT